MRRLVLALALVCAGATLAVPTTALARNPAADPAPAPGPRPTSLPDGITLRGPSVVKAGQMIEVDAILASGGLLRPDASLHFIIDDVERRVERTDAEGVAHFRLRGVLASGSHHLLVRYGGTTQSYWSGPAAASASFVVAPLIITVQTVPSMPGITLSLDGHGGVVSNADGEAIIAVARAGIHTLAVKVPPADSGSLVTFTRWSDDSWKPSRLIRVVKDLSISVGLRAAYLTQIQFEGLDHNRLDPSQVSDVVISGPNAEVIQLQYPYEPVWLQTPMPAKHSGEGGLHVTPAPYSLSFARYAKLNVASTGQFRYTPERGGTWSIPLLLFTLRLGAKDAIFGTTLGDPIKLINPTGRAQTLKLDNQGRTTLILGRGNYAAQVQAAGVTPTATIALSRSQEVIVPVITPADLFVIALAMLVIGGGVFVIGRGRLWTFGRLTAVRVRYEDPIIQRWARTSPQRQAVQAATVGLVGSLTRRGQPVPSPQLETATGQNGVECAPAVLSPPILAGGADGEPAGMDIAAGGWALPPLRASFASRAVSTFPRSYLLADDASLGQAIEVGLIIRGLMNAGKAERFLLLVHQAVMGQWQLELKDKFGLRVPRFERGTFYDHRERELAWSGNPWSAFPIVLASSHLARRRDRRNELLAAAPWDVVFVDEAHEAHRSGSKPTGTPNKLLAVLQVLKSSESWKALYLASATRRQMHLHEAWDLMELLELTKMPADVANDFARYFTIPWADRPDGDWEFLRQLCADYFEVPGAKESDVPLRTGGRKPRATRNRSDRRRASQGFVAGVTMEPAQEAPVPR